MTIKIYQKEIDDGIGDVVKSTASVAYCSEAILHEGDASSAKESISDKEILNKILAENKDQIDLYYLESVLVSTGWNKNDDVFLSQATWEARDTPEDKQFNFMHDENDIIGHITGSYILTKDGKAVAEDSQRPDEFDIVTQAVIYNSWSGPENQDRMNKIIAEIKEGKWYVSMECLFAGFDYAMIDKEGSAKILARDEESAFLTKHLRSYGGSGEYEGYKVGRALKSISFSGKGLVAKPANPRSIILKAVAFDIDHNSNFNIGDFTMAENLLEKQLEEVRSELTASKAENKAIKAKIEEAKDNEFSSTVEAFESTIQDKDTSLAELEESIKSTQARVAELEDALIQSQEELTVATNDMNDMKKAAKSEKRKASLVEAGFDDEEAEESLELYASLSDEAFDIIVAKFNWFDKKNKDEDKDKDKDKKKKKDDEVKAEETETEEEAEAEITQEAFEGVGTSEATLVETEVEDEMESTRASVSSWLENHVLNK
tara:strand:+ start:635 stop:2101 length:1467 start_codon:yes stop_codon:yes gene_type:complete